MQIKFVCDEVSRRLVLAEEARRDYQAAKLDRNTKAAVLHLKRDQMEIALLNLAMYMEDNWSEIRKRVPGTYGS